MCFVYVYLGCLLIFGLDFRGIRILYCCIKEAPNSSLSLYLFDFTYILTLILLNMSLLQKSFLKVPLQDAVMLYNNEIVPRLTKKNKVIAISVAIVMYLVYLVTDRILTTKKTSLYSLY